MPYLARRYMLLGSGLAFSVVTPTSLPGTSARCAEAPFSITISAMPDTVRAGSEVRLNIVYTNTSRHEVALVRTVGVRRRHVRAGTAISRSAATTSAEGDDLNPQVSVIPGTGVALQVSYVSDGQVNVSYSVASNASAGARGIQITTFAGTSNVSS
jgi:hypothetical protein